MRPFPHQPCACHRPRVREPPLCRQVGRRLVPDRTVGPNDGDNSSGHEWVGGLSGFRSVFDMSYAGLLQQHNESLQRMGQPYVDGILLHGPGGMTDPAGKAAGDHPLP